MITGFFLNLIYLFLMFLLHLLPAGGSFPTAFVTGVQTIWNAIQAFNFIVPTEMLVFCLGVSFTFHAFVWMWNATMWILSVIRGHKVW